MDDLIRRQDAIDALKNERSDWNCDYNVPVDHCIDAIYSVPSAQPERKKRRWIKGINENGVTTSLFCSECNYENKHWYEWNFCPNCGAEMRGEENEDNDK